MLHRKLYIPAIEAVTEAAVKGELVKLGYTGIDNTMQSWIKRRKIPDHISLKIMFLASRRGVRLTEDDFKVVPVPQEARAMASA